MACLVRAKTNSPSPAQRSVHAGAQKAISYQCMMTDAELNRLQLTTLQYYMHESNPANGLVRDKTDKNAPASIAAVGLALASLPILVERGVLSREFAPEIALRRLRFFRDSPHGPEPDATGYKGFYYHFLDMKSGRRVWNCELSTIDSAFLFAGMLTCAAYFDGDNAEEGELALPLISTPEPIGNGC